MFCKILGWLIGDKGLQRFSVTALLISLLSAGILYLGAANEMISVLGDFLLGLSFLLIPYGSYRFYRRGNFYTAVSPVLYLFFLPPVLFLAGSSGSFLGGRVTYFSGMLMLPAVVYMVMFARLGYDNRLNRNPGEN